MCVTSHLHPIKPLNHSLTLFLHLSVIVGPQASGKTELNRRLGDPDYDLPTTPYVATIGAEFQTATVSTATDEKVFLQVWDAAGDPRFATIASSYCRGAHAVVVTFDVTSRESFEGVRVWLETEREVVPSRSPVVVAGLKTDLEEARVVARREAQAMAAGLELAYMEASAKTGAGVLELFTTVAQMRAEVDGDVWRREPPSALNETASQKTVLIGPTRAGKTSLAWRLARDDFDETEVHRPTCGVDFLSTRVDLGDGERVSLVLWDTGGSGSSRVSSTYIKGADSVVFVFDVTNAESFRDLSLQIPQTMERAKHGWSTHAIIVGAKTDCTADRVITRKMADALGKLYELPYFEISAKTSSIHSVRALFARLVRWVRTGQLFQYHAFVEAVHDDSSNLRHMVQNAIYEPQLLRVILQFLNA